MNQRFITWVENGYTMIAPVGTQLIFTPESLRARLRERDESLVRIAAETGISVGWLSKFRADKYRSSPRWSQLERLRNWLDLAEMR